MMPNKHLLSIIVPVYNARAYMKDTINDLLDQTYKDIEILLIDDGSTDGSSDICDKYAENDQRIVAIHQTNQGVSAARNTGIEKSTGDLLAFADSDDRLDPDMYELLIQAMDETGADVSASSYRIEKDSKCVKTQYHNSAPKSLVFSGGVPIYESITNSKNSIEGLVVNKVWKRSIVGEHRFNTSVFMCEDLLFTWTTLKDAKSVSYIDLPLYHYIFWPSSSVRTASLQKNLGALEVWQKIYHDAIAISPKCVPQIGQQTLLWTILTFNSLIPVYKSNKEVYTQLKQNCIEYQEFASTMSKRHRLYVEAIKTNYYFGAMIIKMSKFAKRILNK